MSHTLHFRPEIEKDLITGYLWYEEKNKGLGEEFLRVFYAQLRGISENPLLFRKVRKEIRRSILKRFPYAVYFQIENQDIIVFGLFHCARNPDYLNTFLDTRTGL
jgi:plasmid stabilization system protein ParE